MEAPGTLLEHFEKSAMGGGFGLCLDPFSVDCEEEIISREGLLVGKVTEVVTILDQDHQLEIMHLVLGSGNHQTSSEESFGQTCGRNGGQTGGSYSGVVSVSEVGHGVAGYGMSIMDRWNFFMNLMLCIIRQIY